MFTWRASSVRLLKIGVAAALLSLTIAQPGLGETSATKARDINGFSLGMDIRDADKLSHLTQIDGTMFGTTLGGIKYQLEFSPSGSLFSIESRQELGRFAVDEKIRSNFRDALIQKYGPPSRDDGTLLWWSLSEWLRHSDGSSSLEETMWMTANLSQSGFPEIVTVELRLLDWRILWADQRRLNEEPARRGESRMKF